MLGVFTLCLENSIFLRVFVIPCSIDALARAYSLSIFLLV